MVAGKVERSGGRGRWIEGLRGIRRRKQWTASEKAQILAESFFPGVNISAVARRHGVAANVLFRWRREALDTSSSEPATFSPVTVGSVSPYATDMTRCETPEDAASGDASGTRSGVIEIELAGARIRLRGAVSEEHLRIALAAVRGLA